MSTANKSIADHELEEIWLSTLIHHPEALPRVLAVESSVDLVDSEKLRQLWRGVIELYKSGTPVDPTILTSYVKNRGYLAASEIEPLLERILLVYDAPDNMEGWTAELQALYQRRRLIRLSKDLEPMARNMDQEVDAIIRYTTLHLQETSRTARPTDVGEVAQSIIDRFDQPASVGAFDEKVPLSWVDLNQIMGGGVEYDDYIGVAARPGSGKTSYAIQESAGILMNSEEGIVNFFSMETGPERITTRLCSSICGVPYAKVRSRSGLSDEERELVLATLRMIKEKWRERFNIFSGKFTVDMISHILRGQKATGRKILMTWIDNFQLMPYRQLDDKEQASRDLKSLTLEIRSPVGLLIQLNRSNQKENRPPRLDDIKACITGDAIVIDGDTKEPLRLEDVEVGMRVMSVSKDQKVVAGLVTDKLDRGQRLVYEMTTSNGRRIKATGDHEFLTGAGWKRLDELSKDDRIATLWRFDSNTAASALVRQKDICRLMGYLTGDGCVLDYTSLQIACNDDEVLNDVADIVTTHFPSQTIRHKEGTFAREMLIVQPNDAGRGNPGSNDLRTFFREEGFLGYGAADKRIPKYVFRAGQEGICHFLAGYLETDGSVKSERGGAHLRVQYDSVSRKLLEDVQIALAYLGIASSIGKPEKKVNFFGETKDRPQPLYRLYVSSFAANMQRFVDVLPVIGRKTHLMNSLADGLASGVTGGGPFGLPIEVSSRAAELHASWRDQGKMMRRDTCVKLAQETDSAELSVWAESDLLWESVRSIREVGEEQVYDLTISDHHNFIANGIVAHNCGQIEQDLDRCILIDRADHRCRHLKDEWQSMGIVEGLALFDVAKNRDYGQGEIWKMFDGPTMSFIDAVIERKEEESAKAAPDMFFQ